MHRRLFISRLGAGLGSIGLANALHADEPPHHRPRARRVIQLFMNGGPFGPDFLDPKPALTRHAGDRPAGTELRTERPTGGLLPSPFTYQRHGQSGLPVSELLPETARHADRLCVLRSVHTDNPNHGPALLLMNNGTMTPRVPSMGAWISYGIGSENRDLPAYVVLCPGRPVRFSILWNSAFLPGKHAGLYVNHALDDVNERIPWLRGSNPRPDAQRRQLDLLRDLNRLHLEPRDDGDPRLEARIDAMETACRMQTSATDAFDSNREPEAVRSRYGSSHFAQGCLLARRLSERGVRFVQVYYGNGQPWDTHGSHNAQTRNLAADIDRPIAALLDDLLHRGLLDETLVVWGGEFGRTPVSESGDGRDHNPHGFLMWLAGAGTRGGSTYGATDEFGFRAVHQPLHIHDLHATVLHLLGLDHTRLTFRHAGRDFRLTDVHGRVVRELLA